MSPFIHHFFSVKKALTFFVGKFFQFFILIAPLCSFSTFTIYVLRRLSEKNLCFSRKVVTLPPIFKTAKFPLCSPSSVCLPCRNFLKCISLLLLFPHHCAPPIYLISLLNNGCSYFHFEMTDTDVERPYWPKSQEKLVLPKIKYFHIMFYLFVSLE